MKASHKLTLSVLLALLLAALVGLLLTNDSGHLATLLLSHRTPRANDNQLVDQSALDTAHKLAGEAETRSERPLAAEAVRVADHELDLAFSSALEAAQQAPPPQSAAAKATEEKTQRIEARISANQDQIKQLTAKLATAKGPQQERLQGQLELAQAELTLDQDALADAKEDLARAGGDNYTKIQRLLQEHQAAEKEDVNAPAASAPANPPAPAANLISRWNVWRSLSTEQADLKQAQQDAAKQAAALAQRHDALNQRIQAAQAQKRNQAEQAASLLASGQKAGPDSSQLAKAAVDSLHSLSADRKEISSLDQRLQDMQRLGVIYGQWSALVNARARAYLHRVILSGFWILLILLAAFLLSRLLDRLFSRFTSDRRQLHTLRAVARFAVQSAALLWIVFLIFGVPSQLSTILGLVGAGLTVALQDFIIAFLGWFVIMGRHGIRVGDWVEINGVRGEVIEIGLLRTLLLESGNWNDPGHPTGRQIAFLNRYAVDGTYFNFSTSGQWLWDQLQVSLPPGVDPYRAIERIREVVEKETAEGAKQAQKEWERVTHRYGMQPFSAEPAITLRPSSQGVEVVIGYITRAQERYEVRSRLNHTLAQSLNEKKTVPPAPSSAAS
jgi:small-conductance mechanosensitive channel